MARIKFTGHCHMIMILYMFTLCFLILRSRLMSIVIEEYNSYFGIPMLCVKCYMNMCNNILLVETVFRLWKNSRQKSVDLISLMHLLIILKSKHGILKHRRILFLITVEFYCFVVYTCIKTSTWTRIYLILIVSHGR